MSLILTVATHHSTSMSVNLLPVSSLLQLTFVADTGYDFQELIIFMVLL